MIRGMILQVFFQVGIIRLPVCRTGNLSLTVMVDYHCYDGLAKNVEDYEVRNSSARVAQRLILRVSLLEMDRTQINR